MYFRDKLNIEHNCILIQKLVILAHIAYLHALSNNFPRGVGNERFMWQDITTKNFTDGFIKFQLCEHNFSLHFIIPALMVGYKKHFGENPQRSA